MFTAWYGLYFCAQFGRVSVLRLVAGLSPLGPRFDPRTVHLRFVVFKQALGQVCLPVLQFSPVSIIPPTLRTHLHLHVALTRRPNKRSLETFQKATPFRKSGSIGWSFIFCNIHKVRDNICLHLEAENTLRFVREIAESIMNDIECERNFVLVGKECTNEGS